MKGSSRIEKESGFTQDKSPHILVPGSGQPEEPEEIRTEVRHEGDL